MIEQKEESKLGWAGFIETEVVNFFNENDLEKITLEDGRGNKAKLLKQRDNTIKVEYTSSTIL